MLIPKTGFTESWNSRY